MKSAKNTSGHEALEGVSMIQVNRTLLLVVFLIALLALNSCQTSPTGRQQFVVIPEGQVDQMGIQAFEEMKTKQPINRDEKTTAYVRCVANAVTSAMSDGRQWEVVIFQDKAVNAFALPGGKIGVYTGILPVANTPGQLGAIIGHEIGHVIAQHGRERISQQMTAQGVMAVTSALFENHNSRTYQLAMAGLGLGTQFGVLLPFGRAQESEADVIGLELMAKAGFDPREAIQLWQNMGKASSGQSTAQPPEWMSTHPSNETRIRNLEKHMTEATRHYQNANRKPGCVK